MSNKQAIINKFMEEGMSESDALAAYQKQMRLWASKGGKNSARVRPKDSYSFSDKEFAREAGKKGKDKRYGNKI